MSNLNAITVLTCMGDNKIATKLFAKRPDGTIEKKSFDAGIFFEHETAEVSNLDQLAALLKSLAKSPDKFLVKGQIKPGMPKLVRRKVHEPDAAFDAVARPYVVLDIDKLSCPGYFDATTKPDEIIGWVQSALPESFRDRRCVYRFSASQGVHPGQKTVSLHLYFWLDRPVGDDEWKRYFKSVSAPVDHALFSAVQPVFTANPLFENMADPIPNRIGIFEGLDAPFPVPSIPERDRVAPQARASSEPAVNEENKQSAIALLLPNYREGSRDRMCGAIAATLYRGGWCSENAADFVHRLATAAGDDEANKRHDSALRICDAVDSNLPAQGYNALKTEFGIDNLDAVMDLLGVGRPDVGTAIGRLNSQSTIDDIKKVLVLLMAYPKAQRGHFIDKVTKQTASKKGSLNALMAEVESEKSPSKACDVSDQLMEAMLKAEFEGSDHLLLSSDRTYWQYNGLHWEAIPVQHIKKTLLPHARAFVRDLGHKSVAEFNNSVMNILEGRVYREDDPLRQSNQDAQTIINCLNGELCFDENGNATLKPHRPQSYLRQCLDVEYDPAATCPMFDKACLEIFANSSDPDDMYRHFQELAGYICQPGRKHAIILLMHGGGSNGKTSLIKIVMRMLGKDAVMSDRIGDIEDNIFKIGALDGKLMLLDDDVDAGTLLPDGFLKKISEEKHMTGQHKHKEPFQFQVLAVPVMLANDYPVMSDLSYGMTRRMMAIPFKRTFAPHEVRLGLFDDIWAQEASGILNRIVEGFGRLKKRGSFQQPADCVAAKREWIVRSNILATFIDEKCEEADGFRIPLGEFYNAFKDYCGETGVRNLQSLKGVHGRLEGLGYRIGLLDGKRTVWGLRLVTDDPRATTTPRM